MSRTRRRAPCGTHAVFSCALLTRPTHTTPPIADVDIARAVDAVVAHHAAVVAAAVAAAGGSRGRGGGSARATEVPRAVAEVGEYIELVACALGQAPVDVAAAGAPVPPSSATDAAGQSGAGAAVVGDGEDSAAVSSAIASFWTDALLTTTSGSGLVTLMRCALAAAGASPDLAEHLVAKRVLMRGRKAVTLPADPAVQAELLVQWAEANCPGMFTFLLAGWVEDAFLLQRDSDTPAAGDDGDGSADSRGGGALKETVVSDGATMSPLRAFGRQCVSGNAALWSRPRSPVPRAVRTDGTAIDRGSTILTKYASPGLAAAALPATFRAARSAEWVLLYASRDMGTGANRLTTHVFG
jgi:hypothetical protein